MVNLLERSEGDASLARLALNAQGGVTFDEVYDDLAAYHAQQAVEKAIKYTLEMCGVPYRKTHDIATLLAMLGDVGFPIPDVLILKAGTITSWEARCRYNDDFVALRSDVLSVLAGYDELKQRILKWLGEHVSRIEHINAFVHEAAIKQGFTASEAQSTYIRSLAEVYNMTHPSSTLSDVEKAYEILK